MDRIDLHIYAHSVRLVNGIERETDMSFYSNYCVYVVFSIGQSQIASIYMLEKKKCIYRAQTIKITSTSTEIVTETEHNNKSSNC